MWIFAPQGVTGLKSCSSTPDQHSYSSKAQWMQFCLHFFAFILKPNEVGGEKSLPLHKHNAKFFLAYGVIYSSAKVFSVSVTLLGTLLYRNLGSFKSLGWFFVLTPIPLIYMQAYLLKKLDAESHSIKLQQKNTKWKWDKWICMCQLSQGRFGLIECTKQKQ